MPTATAGSTLPIDSAVKLTGLEQDTLDAIRRLRRGAPKSVSDRAHSLLCRRFMPFDTMGKNFQFAYLDAVNEVVQGLVDVSRLEEAFLRAIHPSAKHPGKIFAYNMNRPEVSKAI